ASAWKGEVASVVPDALDGCADADVVILRSDLNWWTVFGQLDRFSRQDDARGAEPPVFLVHGTDAPTARRDQYSDPDRIPAEARHPCQLVGRWWRALDEGTPRNGVLTAVEDYADGRERVSWQNIPGFGGTAIVVSEQLMTGRPAEFVTLLYA